LLNNHAHFALLEHYFNQSEELDWVMATIVNKEGSSYRSPGAIMLINSLGQSFGLVSGGCLEANIILHAKKVFDSKQAYYVEYDMRDEDDYAAELGVGCKGKIGVLLQYLTPEHKSLLGLLFQRMQSGVTSYLQHTYQAENENRAKLNSLTMFDSKGQVLVSTEQQSEAGHPQQIIRAIALDKPHSNAVMDEYEFSLTKISAPFNLWLFGGGSDVIPLVSMATQLGWRVTVVDHRSSYARNSVFKQANDIYRIHPDDFFKPENIEQVKLFQQLDAAVLMTHNLTLDAAWLNILHSSNQAKYIGLLGPLERRSNVETLSNIADRAWLARVVNGPVGFDIGGELPESIALSILAQCHSVLHNRSGLALSGKFINS
jgi:xanthine dehydrogenase accessory factor